MVSFIFSPIPGFGCFDQFSDRFGNVLNFRIDT